MNLFECLLDLRTPVLLFALGMALGSLIQAISATAAPKLPPSNTSNG